MHSMLGYGYASIFSTADSQFKKLYVITAHHHILLDEEIHCLEFEPPLPLGMICDLTIPQKIQILCSVLHCCKLVEGQSTSCIPPGMAAGNGVMHLLVQEGKTNSNTPSSEGAHPLPDCLS